MRWVDTKGQSGKFVWYTRTHKITLPTTEPVWFNHKMSGQYVLRYKEEYLDNLAKNLDKFEQEEDQTAIIFLFFLLHKDTEKAFKAI